MAKCGLFSNIPFVNSSDFVESCKTSLVVLYVSFGLAFSRPGSFTDGGFSFRPFTNFRLCPGLSMHLSISSGVISHRISRVSRPSSSNFAA